MGKVKQMKMDTKPVPVCFEVTNHQFEQLRNVADDQQVNMAVVAKRAFGMFLYFLGIVRRGGKIIIEDETGQQRIIDILPHKNHPVDF